jgi:hypothetical protein
MLTFCTLGGPQAAGSVGSLSTPLERCKENTIKPTELLCMMKHYWTAWIHLRVLLTMINLINVANILGFVYCLWLKATQTSECSYFSFFKWKRRERYYSGVIFRNNQSLFQYFRQYTCILTLSMGGSRIPAPIPLSTCRNRPLEVTYLRLEPQTLAWHNT